MSSCNETAMLDALGQAIRKLGHAPESPVAVFGLLDVGLVHDLDLDDRDLWFREMGLTDEQYEVVEALLTHGQPRSSWNGCAP